MAFPLSFGVICLTFQTTLLTLFPFQRIRPDLVLILTLYLGLYYPPVSGGTLALFMGLLMDLFSGNGFGLYTLSRPLVFYSAQFFKGRVFLESLRSQFLFAFVFGLVEGLLILILVRTLNPNPAGHLYALLFTFLLPQSFFTGLMTPALFFLIRKGSSSLTGHHGLGMIVRGDRL
ncbi:MAG: rod shape-determining protein MreD [Thermodesulfobacteriota bacterium]